MSIRNICGTDCLPGHPDCNGYCIGLERHPKAYIPDELTTRDWESMYIAQCACTDKWVAKHRAEVERKADATLLARCEELEAIAEAANRKFTAAQARIEALERALAGEATEEKGWLLEWSGVVGDKVVGPVAWLYLRPKYNGFGALEFGSTQDSTKALRLCRKEDAEAVLKLHLGGGPKPDWYTKPYSVTEHIWADKAMRDAALGDLTPLRSS